MRILKYLGIALLVYVVYMYFSIKQFIDGLKYEFSIKNIRDFNLADLTKLGSSSSEVMVDYQIDIINNSDLGFKFRNFSGEFYSLHNGSRSLIGTASSLGKFSINKNSITKLTGSAKILLNSSFIGTIMSSNKDNYIEYVFTINWFGLPFKIRGELNASELKK